MKEHQQSGKVNCPKCGADECFRSPGEFRCGSGNCVDADDFDQSDICLELCDLRSKLTPEGAESLKWEYDLPTRTHIAEGAGGRILAIVHRDGIDLWCDDEVVMEHFITIDAANAHAEELHQAAFKEFIEKWGKK